MSIHMTQEGILSNHLYVTILLYICDLYSSLTVLNLGLHAQYKSSICVQYPALIAITASVSNNWQTYTNDSWKMSMEFKLLQYIVKSFPHKINSRADHCCDLALYKYDWSNVLRKTTHKISYNKVTLLLSHIASVPMNETNRQDIHQKGN